MMGRQCRQVNDIAVKYLLRRCEACLTASEASSYDEVKFLPSANDEGLRRIVLPQSLRDSSPNEGAKRAFLAEEGGFSEGKDGWSSHDISHGRILQVYISAYLFWERWQTARSDEEGNSELY